MAIVNTAGNVDQFALTVLGMRANHVERLARGERVPGHQYPLRLLDHGSTVEGALQASVREPMAPPTERPDGPALG